MLIVFLWVIPSLLALGMVGYLLRCFWRDNQQLTFNQTLIFLAAFVMASLPIFSIIALAIGYLFASAQYGFGNRPLLVSRHLKNERLASRLRGDH